MFQYSTNFTLNLTYIAITHHLHDNERRRQASTMIAMQWNDLLSIVLVGAFWGCTNPLLRKGSSDLPAETSSSKVSPDDSPRFSLGRSLSKFRRFRVWLPYLLNQCGSLLYYKLLASSDLTFAVPVCNALSLVFSFFTSFCLGERVDKPLQALGGAALVMTGIAVCMASREGNDGSIEGEGVLNEEL